MGKPLHWCNFPEKAYGVFDKRIGNFVLLKSQFTRATTHLYHTFMELGLYIMSLKYLLGYIDI